MSDDQIDESANQTQPSSSTGDISQEIDLTDVYKVQTNKLTPKEAYGILSKFDPEKHTHTQRIVNEEPGHMYIFFSNDPNRIKDVTTDKYSWINNGAFKMQPANEPYVFKSYYWAKNSAGKASKFQ
jgi:hypothetical protein